MRFATPLAIMAAAVLGTIAASGAPAQEAPRCQVVGVKDAGLLLICGERLNGFVLTLDDVRRQVGNEPEGRFVVRCVLAPMCEDEPNVGGFFIDPSIWVGSAKDEPAILEILQRHGLVPAAAAGADPRRPPPAACAVFDVTVGDLAGRAVCFDVADGSAVLIIAGDDRVALVLSIFQRNRTPGAMREKAQEMLPQFKLKRPTGDIALLRWMR